MSPQGSSTQCDRAQKFQAPKQQRWEAGRRWAGCVCECCAYSERLNVDSEQLRDAARTRLVVTSALASTASALHVAHHPSLFVGSLFLRDPEQDAVGLRLHVAGKHHQNILHPQPPPWGDPPSIRSSHFPSVSLPLPAATYYSSSSASFLDRQKAWARKHIPYTHLLHQAWRLRSPSLAHLPCRARYIL